MDTVSRHLLHQESVTRWGGASVALGSLGVVVTSAFYSLSPSVAALPVAPSRVTEAFVAAQSDGGAMWAAGTTGMMGDLVFAAGALALAAAQLSRGGGAEPLGWIWIALSNLLFTVVDAVVGRVLQPVSGLPDAQVTFAAIKWLFDALFATGTFAFGVGAILALAPTLARPGASVDRVLAGSGVAIGAVAAMAGVLCLFGADLGRVLGLTIALGSVLFTIIGTRVAWAARPARL